jgi:hypothetical protein
MYNNDVVLTNYLLHESVEKGQAEPVEADSLTRELLDTNKCYIVELKSLYGWGEILLLTKGKVPAEQRK